MTLSNLSWMMEDQSLGDGGTVEVSQDQPSILLRRVGSFDRGAD